MKRTIKTVHEAREDKHPADLEDGIHDTHHPATKDDVGSMARAVLTDGTLHATGRIVAYTDAPTVTLRDAAGDHHHWRADLTNVIENNTPIQIPRHLYNALVHAKTPAERNDAINAIVKDTQ